MIEMHRTYLLSTYGYYNTIARSTGLHLCNVVADECEHERALVSRPACAGGSGGILLGGCNDVGSGLFDEHDHHARGRHHLDWAVRMIHISHQALEYSSLVAHGRSNAIAGDGRSDVLMRAVLQGSSIGKRDRAPLHAPGLAPPRTALRSRSPERRHSSCPVRQVRDDMNDADLPVMWQKVCRSRFSPGETLSAAAEGGTMMPYSWHSFQVRVVASSVSLAKAFASATSSCRQSQQPLL